MCQKEKLLVLSNFFFCHYVFKKPSAEEASESVYMRERVKHIVTKGVIVHHERFRLFVTIIPNSINMFSFKESFNTVTKMISKSAAADLLCVGKGRVKIHAYE